MNHVLWHHVCPASIVLDRKREGGLNSTTATQDFRGSGAPQVHSFTGSQTCAIRPKANATVSTMCALS